MSCQDLEPDADLATFTRWNTTSLKDYLRRRGLQTSYSKNELCALAFAANYLALPLKLTAGEKEKVLFEQYQDLLTVQNEKYPDPLAEIKDGWLSESAGMKTWPPTMYYDVCEFLLNDTKGVDLARRVFKDYKQKKGFSFLTSGFLFELKYHYINPQSKMCFLKAECKPSQRIGNTPHTAWVMINKESGNIVRAYCTCIAGRGQSCLHITAMLMKVDMAWKYGLTNPACTSTECNWLRKPQLVLAPSKICDMEISSPKYCRVPKNINNASKHLFIPHKKDKGKSLFEFLEDVREIVPNAVVYSEHKEKPLPKRPKLLPSEEKFDMPEKVLDIALQCYTINQLNAGIIRACGEKIDVIAAATTSQAKSDQWFEQRHGRITASKFKQVYTKCKTFTKKSQSNINQLISDPLIKRIIFGQNLYSTPAMKHGINTEPFALESFLTFWKAKHRNTTNRSSGLVLDKIHPYIAATPDQLLSCDCHGDGVLEIKCPWKASHTKPSPEFCNYLHVEDGKVSLKSTHEYYYQIQGQMAVLGVKYCEFWVFTYHGYHHETIFFDDKFWKDLQLVLVEFWNNFLGPAILSLKESTSDNPINSPIAFSTPSQVEASASKSDGARNISDYVDSDNTNAPLALSTPSQVEASTSQCEGAQNITDDVDCDNTNTHIAISTPPQVKVIASISDGAQNIADAAQSVCIVCDKICKAEDEIKLSKDYSVGCDICSRWFHLPCVKLNRKSKELKWPQWFCKNCE